MGPCTWIYLLVSWC